MAALPKVDCGQVQVVDNNGEVGGRPGIRGSQEKVLLYQKKVSEAVENFFPMITVRRKSTNPPWINTHICNMIKRQRVIYRAQGRSAQWRRLIRKTETLVQTRRLNIDCLLYTSPSPRD